MNEQKLEAAESQILLDPEESAEIAGLRYVSDTEPGFGRRRAGSGFVYIDKSGDIITDEKKKSRIESLVIPPAWENVWISPFANGHIQATGRDSKGRKQYIYHPRWDEVRNFSKFGKIVAFGETLPLIRMRVEEDLRKTSFRREKVLAIIVRLLEMTMIRVGNKEYALTNGSYGLTTLRNRHLDVKGQNPRFIFKGKSGKMWEVNISDRRIARLVKQCQELPGQHLFQYYDESDKLVPVGSSDVNGYLKEIIGQDYTAKDFRTWGGTVTAAKILYSAGKGETDKDNKKKIVDAVKHVSTMLNNTPSVCRKYYIHPDILDSYLDGRLFEVMESMKDIAPSSPFDLSPEESAVLSILRQALDQKSPAA